MNPRISLSVLLAALLDLAAGGAFAATTAAQTATPAPAARLTILVDNSVARTGVKAVWGFACLVEAASYDVVVSNSVGAVTSNVAVLSLTPAVWFTSQPASRTVYAGTAVTLTASAAGYNATPTYQWRKDGVAIAAPPAVRSFSASFKFQAWATTTSWRLPVSLPPPAIRLP